MPRYFFDLDDQNHDADDDGTDLADPDEARAQAVIFAGDYLREHPGLVHDGSRFTVQVRDEHRNVLLRVVVVAEYPTRSGGGAHIAR